MKAAIATEQNDEMILIEHLPCQLDGGIAARAKIGLIVLATDYTIEHEWQQVFYNLDGVALYHSRILNEDVITPESLRAMEPRITASAGLITPDTPLDVVAYGCTSASMAIGEDKVFENIRQVEPDARCTTPITGAFAAFKAFNANRIAVLTPYPADVNRIVAKYIADRGVAVPVFGSLFNLPLGQESAISTARTTLLVWNSSFFIKEPNSPDFVSWHQDLTYWGLNDADEITAWIALSPATIESGCMRFVPSSHNRGKRKVTALTSILQLTVDCVRMVQTLANWSVLVDEDDQSSDDFRPNVVS